MNDNHIPIDIHTHRGGEAGQSIVSLSATELLSPSSFPASLFSIGIHPWDVTDNWKEIMEKVVRPALALPHAIAVGEAGLDRLSGAGLALQVSAFTAQALLAEETGKPLIIHCVKAFDELIRLYRQLRPATPWIIHGFRGKPEQATQLLRIGFHLSFGQYYHEGSLRLCPADRLFIETDDSPEDIHTLYARAARLREITIEELVAQTRENIKRVCSQTMGDSLSGTTVSISPYSAVGSFKTDG